jgi:hypothetical protein
LDLGGELWAIVKAIKSGEVKVRIFRCSAVSVSELQKRLLQSVAKKRLCFHYNHFSGHGRGQHMAMNDQEGQEQLVSLDGFAEIMKWYFDEMPDARCVLLNACDTFTRGGELCKLGIPVVICMKTGIEDAAAKVFASGFYQAIAHGYRSASGERQRRQAQQQQQQQRQRQQDWPTQPGRPVHPCHAYEHAKRSLLATHPEASPIVMLLRAGSFRQVTTDASGASDASGSGSDASGSGSTNSDSDSTAPERLTPRQDQLEAIDAIVKRNTILHWGTGTGKTFVALLVMERLLLHGHGQATRHGHPSSCRYEPGGCGTVIAGAGHGGDARNLAAFIVPTKSLVDQQAGFLRGQLQHHCGDVNDGGGGGGGGSSIRVVELTGSVTDQWSEADWRGLRTGGTGGTGAGTHSAGTSGCAGGCAILVCTHEVLRSALIDKRVLFPRSFAIMVFDECHNATGNSPMALILEDSVHKLQAREQPRLLGLTASYLHGKVENVERKKTAFCQLFCGAEFLCDSSPGAAAQDHQHQMIPVPFTRTAISEWRQVVAKSLGSILEYVQVRQAARVLKRGENVLEQLGISGFIFFIQEGVVKQLLAQKAKLLSMCGRRSGSGAAGSDDDLAAVRKIEKLHRLFERELPGLQTRLQEAARRLSDMRQRSQLPNVSDKLDQLMRILRAERARGGRSSRGSGGAGAGTGENANAAVATFRGIVFVEQVSLTYPLADLINDQFGEDVAAPVSGSSSMSDQVATTNMSQHLCSMVACARIHEQLTPTLTMVLSSHKAIFHAL